MKIKRLLKIKVLAAACGVLAIALSAGILLALNIGSTVAAPASIHDWSEFIAALDNPTVSEINLTTSLAAASSPTINRDITINGNGHAITFGTFAINLGPASAGTALRLENITLTRGAVTAPGRFTGAAIDTANWRIELEVNNWAQFQTALAEPLVREIELKSDVTRVGTVNADRPPDIARSLTIVGNGHTINFGSDDNIAAGVGLLAAPAGTVLRLENFNFIKHGASTNAASRARAAFYGTEAATANWTIEVVDITSGTATNQEGLLVAAGARAVVKGTQNALYIEMDARNHFDVRHLEMTAGAEMELYTRYLTRTGTTSSGRGGSDTNIVINSNGTVLLREDSVLSVWNYGGTNTQSERGSNGIVGEISDLTLEPRAELNVFTANIGYWTTVRNSLTMTGGAVFNATTVGWNVAQTNAQSAIALCRDLSNSNNGFPATILIEGEGTEVNIFSTNNDTGVSGGAWSVKGPGSVMTVTNGARLTSHSTESTALVFQGEDSVFNITNGGEVYLRQDASPNNLTSTLRFRSTGDFTFNVDGGKIQIDQFDPTGNPAIRMFGGNNFINVTNGGHFRVFTRGDGTGRNGTSNSENQGIQYTGSGPANGFYSSGQDANGNPSVIEIIAPFGPAIISASPLTVEANDGAVFLAHGRTSATNNAAGRRAATIATEGTSSNYLRFTLDNPMYFDIRNYSTIVDGAAAVYSEVNSGNAGNNIISLTNSDFSVWRKRSLPAGMTSHSNYFEGTPTRAWTLLSFRINGRWMENVAMPDPPHFPSPPLHFAGTQATGAQNYSRISANNAPPMVDALRVPTDADKYLHGHASVQEGIYGFRSAWTDEVYVTVEVRDAAGNPVEIMDMHGNYGYTAEWVTKGMDELNPAGVSVYGDPPQGGIFKVPYIPANAADAYLPYTHLTFTPGSKHFLPEGYTFTVLSAYRSAFGSKTEQALNGDPRAPRVHGADPIRDIVNVLMENQGATFVTVIDKTPPPPAGIDGELDELDRLTIAEGSAIISGISTETQDITVRFSVNGEMVTTDGTPAGNGGTPVTAAVAADGTWRINVPNHITLLLGDVVQVFLTDGAGNTNPFVDMEFHDALFASDDFFPMGTTVHVVESVFVLHIRQIVHNPGDIRMRNWPSAGYSRIADQRSGGSQATRRFHAVAHSGFSPLTEFTTIELQGVFRGNTLRVENVIPQYFSYAGHVASADGPAAGTLQPGEIAILVDADREYWVTVYITPFNFTTPHFSGSVKDNYFGPVTTR